MFLPLRLNKSNHRVKSTLLQRCLLVDMTSRHDTTSNQRWNNVVYFNVGIYNIKQRWINAVYFNDDGSNVRQRRNNFLFNVEIHKWPFLKKTRTKKIISNWIPWIQSFYCYFIIFFTLLPILRRICWRILAKKLKSWKILHCNNLI